jgi:hypothetical protein
MILIPTPMPDHIANRKREKRGFEFLVRHLPGFYAPTSEEKDRLLGLLGISPRFKQMFDAIRLLVPTFSDVKSATDFDLIELKTTDECLPDLPHGFFFGMTENEEMLLKVFEGKYFLCFVCLNEQTPGHRLISWMELRQLIQNKRVQYQINLRARSNAASP